MAIVFGVLAFGEWRWTTGLTLMSPLVRIGLSDPNTVPAVEKLVSDFRN